MDRREHIGEGFLGIAPFGFILNDARLNHLPMAIETPKDPSRDMDKVDLGKLRSLVTGNR